MPDLPQFNVEKLTLAVAGKEVGRWGESFRMVFRAKVAGGWFVFAAGGEGFSGVAFYPDPEHKWDGGTLT